METNHNPKMSAANLSGASGPAGAPWFARGQLAAGQRSVPTGTDPVVVATVSAAGSEPTPTAAHTATSATAADATADITESPPVSRLRLEIGRFAGVEKPAMAFAFDAVMRGSPAEGATLEMIDLPGKALCFDCGEKVEIDDRLAPCPLCGGTRLLPEGGDEMRIRGMEVV